MSIRDLTNYDEEQIRPYRLPSLFPEGCDSRKWEEEVRPQWMAQLTKLQFGALPPPPASFEARCLQERSLPFPGVRRQVEVTLTGQSGEKMTLDVSVYLPQEATPEKPVPAFCILNFAGNHAIDPDPEIPLPSYPRGHFQESNPDPALQRGTTARRFPLELILGRGYAVITCCYCQVYPDRKGDGALSIWRLSQKEPSPYAPAISAWAWGLMRLADLAKEIPEVDEGKLAVCGHSRLGKSALWAGVNDPRFKLVISNDSGMGGASLFRRNYGETFHFMLHEAPFSFWFSPELEEYSLQPEKLPFDAHTLQAMVAPRALYVASASEDQWADPTGEFLGMRHAAPVWSQIYGLPAMGRDVPPPTGQAAHCGYNAYHCRPGKHDINAYDWDLFTRYADGIFGKKEE